MGNLSPFQVFFGRKPNLSNSSSFSSDIEVNPKEEIEEEIEKFFQKCENIRSQAGASSEKAADRMVSRNKRKFPPADYYVGEKVIVKNIYSGKKIRSKFEKTFSGVVKSRNEDRYKVEYIKNGKTEIAWFPVSQMTSITRDIENKKQAIHRSKTLQPFKNPYHLRSNKSKSIRNESSQEMINLKQKSPRYNLRESRISSYKKREKQYSEALAEAIRLSKVEINSQSNLNGFLAQRGLRSVDVEGDGNCFFRVIAHQLYGDSNYHNEVRARAVDQAVNNINDYSEFIEKGDVDEFVASLSTDREWADNLAIQAVSDAFGVTLEIINSNQQRYGTRIISPRTHMTNKLLVIAHIEQLHFMSTEPDFPFPSAQWGGNIDGEKLTNTCPIDGPLSWFMLALSYYPNLMEIVRTLNIFQIIETFELFQSGKSAEGKLHWLQNVAKLDFPDLDCNGSEAEQFFEPLANLGLAKIKLKTECIEHKCTTQITEKHYVPIQQSSESLRRRIESTERETKECADCSYKTATTTLIDLPAILTLPHDYIKPSDQIPTMFVVNGITYILLLISVYEVSKNHFKCIYRFDAKYWIAYDGMDEKREKLFSTPKVNLQDIRFLLYGRCDILNSNEAFVDEVIPDNEGPGNTIDTREGSSSKQRIRSKVIKAKTKAGKKGINLFHNRMTMYILNAPTRSNSALAQFLQ